MTKPAVGATGSQPAVKAQAKHVQFCTLVELQELGWKLDLILSQIATLDSLQTAMSETLTALLSSMDSAKYNALTESIKQLDKNMRADKFQTVASIRGSLPVKMGPIPSSLNP